MLLTNFKEVIALDEQINKLHIELSTLYAERMSITNSTTLSKEYTSSTLVSSTPRSTASWERNQYEILRASWLKFSLAIPAYKSIKNKLAVANAILTNLEEENGQNYYKLLLCPPNSKLTFPLNDQTLSGYEASSYQGFDGSEIPMPSTQKQWKLYIVYDQQQGLPVRDYAEFIRTKQYIIGGYNMRGLDTRLYGIYTLLKNDPVDVGNWSLLLSSKTSHLEQIVCAGYIDNQYRCVIDDTRSLLGENSFRPAMEVK